MQEWNYYVNIEVHGKKCKIPFILLKSEANDVHQFWLFRQLFFLGIKDSVSHFS